MREILFRGKRVDNGEWAEGCYYKQDFFYGDKEEAHYIITSKEALCNDYALVEFEVDPATVGQYTGIEDKNGKQIFEGDIVVDEDTGNIRTVEYHGCRFVFVSLLRHFFHVFYEEGWEVIGNIHDNRELLGGAAHE